MPDRLTTLAVLVTAPPLPVIPALCHGSPLAGVAVCYHGPIEDGEIASGALCAFGLPAAEHVVPMPCTVVQALFDVSAPTGMLNYWRSAHLRGLSDDAIETIVAHTATMAPGLSTIHIYQLGGAMGLVGESVTAFAYRDAPFVLNVISTLGDSAESDKQIQWIRAFARAMEPYANGVYVNFLRNESEERVKAACGANYGRLVVLQNKYDPTNVFHLNQNVKSARSST